MRAVNLNMRRFVMRAPVIVQPRARVLLQAAPVLSPYTSAVRALATTEASSGRDAFVTLDEGKQPLSSITAANGPVLAYFTAA